MNKQLQEFARSTLRGGVIQLPEDYQLMFKRMYSPKNINIPIGDVVETMSEEKLDWAMQQVERSLLKLSTKEMKINADL